jgi:lipopolysaccharide export system protein LptA
MTMSGIKRTAALFLTAGLPLTAGLALAGLLAGGALAQVSTTNPKAPIDITADQAQVVKAECKSVWAGDAEALQSESRLRAKSITAYAAKKGDSCGDTNRLEADGDVYYVTPEQVVRGDHAVYAASSDTVVVTGNVIVLQGKNIARGDRLTIQVKTGAVQMDGPKGRGSSGRVRGVFYPDSTPQKP